MTAPARLAVFGLAAMIALGGGAALGAAAGPAPTPNVHSDHEETPMPSTLTPTTHAGHGDCSEVLHRIFEYLDGEMSADDVRRVAAHLGECQPCLAEHDLDVALKQVVRRSCQGETAPMAIRTQIMARITMNQVENER